MYDKCEVIYNFPDSIYFSMLKKIALDVFFY